MIIGVDFDNTMVCYDQLFHRIAVEQGLIDAATPVSKTAVRDALRAAGGEQDWINLQGLVYGRCILEAPAFPGVHAFFNLARQQGHQLCVISHKTRLPVSGDDVNLHDAATNWLESQGFLDSAKTGLSRANGFFELTKEAKLARIATQRCDHFIDDLPEFLSEPSFPAEVKRWLIHQEDAWMGDAVITPVVSWDEAGQRLMGERMAV